MPSFFSNVFSILSAAALLFSEIPTEFPQSSAKEQPAPDGKITVDGNVYRLSFSDEFDGNELDLTKWSRCPEWKRQDLDCYWEDDCSYLNGSGQLVLEARADNGKYLMGAVRSKGKFEQTYGYFEVRCTLNRVPGYWTAFWLMGGTVENIDGSGVDGTEIDIYESAYLKQSKVNHALHWDGYGASHRSLGHETAVKDLYDGNYHIFSLLWTEDEYVFYIDGNESWRTGAAEAGGTCAAPLYIKLSAETGSWTFSQLDDSLLPDSILIDYVRVYTLG